MVITAVNEKSKYWWKDEDHTDWLGSEPESIPTCTEHQMRKALK